MVAVSEANVEWLSDRSKVATLKLYSTYPDLLATVSDKQKFWMERRLLTLNDVVRVEGILGLMDREVDEVERAKKLLVSDSRNPQLINEVRKETADVVVFAKTYQTFANGTWKRGESRVLEAVAYAKKESDSVGGNLAQDVTQVVKGKNSYNYLRWHYDWGWMLAGREAVDDEAVIQVYDVAKLETRRLRDEQGEDGILPNWLGVAMMQALRSRDAKQLGVWLRDPTVNASMEAMFNIYEVAMSKFG